MGLCDAEDIISGKDFLDQFTSLMEATAQQILRGRPVKNSLSETKNKAAWTETLADRARKAVPSIRQARCRLANGPEEEREFFRDAREV